MCIILSLGNLLNSAFSLDSNVMPPSTSAFARKLQLFLPDKDQPSTTHMFLASSVVNCNSLHLGVKGPATWWPQHMQKAAACSSVRCKLIAPLPLHWLPGCFHCQVRAHVLILETIRGSALSSHQRSRLSLRSTKTSAVLWTKQAHKAQDKTKAPDANCSLLRGTAGCGTSSRRRRTIPS